MRWMRERLNKEEGFTLIELMVVVLIIVILVAIAIPSFLGFRSRAQDRSVQVDLRNVLLAEKGFFIDNVAFTATASDLQSFEQSITLDSAGLVGVDVTLVTTASPVGVCLIRISDSGNSFAIFEDSTASGGTFYRATASGTTLTCPTATGAGTPTGWQTGKFPAA